MTNPCKNHAINKKKNNEKVVKRVARRARRIPRRQNGSKKTWGGDPFWLTFRSLFRRPIFQCISVVLWLTFGSLLAPFGSLSAPFGSLLAHIWCPLAHFGCPCARFCSPWRSLSLLVAFHPIALSGEHEDNTRQPDLSTPPSLRARSGHVASGNLDY